MQHLQIHLNTEKKLALREDTSYRQHYRRACLGGAVEQRLYYRRSPLIKDATSLFVLSAEECDELSILVVKVLCVKRAACPTTNPT